MSAINGWRGHRAVDALAAVCGVLTLVLLAWPVSTTVAPDDLRVATATDTSWRAAGGPATAIDSLARAIVRTNAFSASRTEPTARFVAPGAEPLPAVTGGAVFDAGGATGAISDSDAGPQLFGIVSVGGTPRALLQLHSSSEPPRLLGVGDAFGGVRVVRIAGDRVVISGSSGTRTLRLSRAAPDSSEKVP